MAGDAEYLQATVGAALAKGVAECVCAGPDDPVAFLGNWLKAHVQNATIKHQVCNETANTEAEAQRCADIAALHAESKKAQLTQRESLIKQVPFLLVLDQCKRSLALACGEACRSENAQDIPETFGDLLPMLLSSILLLVRHTLWRCRPQKSLSL